VFLIEPCSPPSSASSTAEIGDTYYAAPHRRHCGSNTGTVIGLSVALGVVCVVLIAVVVAYEVAAKRKD
jgi:2-methylcitrate dehydratase PrpD